MLVILGVSVEMHFGGIQEFTSTQLVWLIVGISALLKTYWDILRKHVILPIQVLFSVMVRKQVVHVPQEAVLYFSVNSLSTLYHTNHTPVKSSVDFLFSEASYCPFYIFHL